MLNLNDVSAIGISSVHLRVCVCAVRRMIAMHRYWKDEKNFKDRPKRDLPLIRGGLFKDKFVPSRHNFMGAEYAFLLAILHSPCGVP